MEIEININPKHIHLIPFVFGSILLCWFLQPVFLQMLLMWTLTVLTGLGVLMEF